MESVIMHASCVSTPIAYVFFFNHTATTAVYTLSLHDALPICTRPAAGRERVLGALPRGPEGEPARQHRGRAPRTRSRSEEHTSELQSLTNLVCRLLLEKKKKTSACANHKEAQTISHEGRDSAW